MAEAEDIPLARRGPNTRLPPSALGAPKPDLPSFGLPKVEIPGAFREIAEKNILQAREAYEKLRTAAEEATDVLEETYTAANKGASDYGQKLIEAARANANAAFDFAAQVMAAKSVSEAVELSTRHARQQYETVTVQAKELAALAQRVAVETSEPLKESFGKFKAA